MNRISQATIGDEISNKFLLRIPIICSQLPFTPLAPPTSPDSCSISESLPGNPLIQGKVHKFFLCPPNFPVNATPTTIVSLKKVSTQQNKSNQRASRQ